MSHKNDRIVFRKNDEQWVNNKINSEKVSSLHNTQKKLKMLSGKCLKTKVGENLLRRS